MNPKTGLYEQLIDIPEVNTVLFLRPTESLTVFLHRKTGNKILLFVRERKQENDFTAPYDFFSARSTTSNTNAAGR